MLNEIAHRQDVCNIEAEQAVLGALMVQNDVYPKIANIMKPEYFYEGLHSRIYEAIRNKIIIGGIAKPSTIFKLFASDETMKEIGGTLYLARLYISTINIAGVLEYASKIIESYIRRETVRLSNKFEDGDFFDTFCSLNETLSAAAFSLEEIGRVDAFRNYFKTQSKAKREDVKKQICTKQKKEADRQDSLATARSEWEKGKPIKGTPAENYLINLGIPEIDWPDVLRFSPECDRPTGQKAPAIMCLVTDSKDDMIAVHKIFLSDSGEKLNTGPTEETVGNPVGGSVRLFPHESKLGLCGRIEDALGAYHLSEGEMPVWAALTPSGVAGFRPPWIVEHISYYPNGDIPKFKWRNRLVGKSEYSCLAAMEKQTIETFMMPVPKIGTGYLDKWNEFRNREAIARANSQ